MIYIMYSVSQSFHTQALYLSPNLNTILRFNFSYRLCIFMCAYTCISSAHLFVETTGHWNSCSGQLYASPHGYQEQNLDPQEEQQAL